MPRFNVPVHVIVCHGKTYDIETVKKMIPQGYRCKVDLASPFQPPSPYLVTIYRDANQTHNDEVVVRCLSAIIKQ